MLKWDFQQPIQQAMLEENLMREKLRQNVALSSPPQQDQENADTLALRIEQAAMQEDARAMEVRPAPEADTFKTTADILPFLSHPEAAA